MFARPTGSEVISGGFQIREQCGAVSPDVSLVGFLLTWGQHAYWHFIAMQNVVFQQGVSQRIREGLQLHTTGTHPFGQGRSAGFRGQRDRRCANWQKTGRQPFS